MRGGSGAMPRMATDLLRRMKALPGYGEQEAQIFVAILGKLDSASSSRGGGRRQGSTATMAAVGRRHRLAGGRAEGAGV